MKFNGSFGGWLRQRRKALDLIQTELADQVGCSVVTLRKIEGDTARPSKQIAERLADVLAITVEERTGFVAFARRAVDSLPALPIDSRSQRPLHNLPRQPTPFVGRAHELAQIAEYLADPYCRLLTLVGVGGIGKTRLALESAAQHIGSFSHGVFFVSLAPINSPDLLLSAVGSSLQVFFRGSENPKVQIINYLCDKNLLLVIDNFEHLLEGIDLFTDLLTCAVGLKILATSRERLNLHEEWVLPMGGLAFPEKGKEDQAESFEAVQLFVQSARRVQPNFSLTENAEAVSDICQTVEGMPLAIELATSWLRAMPCHKIAGQIKRDLNFLTTPLRNLPERHRNIRAVFDHSWVLLSEAERQVLGRLSAFRGGFDPDAAEQVAGTSMIRLSGLVDKSLIRLNASDRYDLHELLRQYAADKLSESGEASAVSRAHFEYFLSLAEQSETYSHGSEQMAWFDRLEVEHDNFRAALAWALGDEVIPNAGLQLAAALGRYWELRAHWVEGQEWLERALVKADNAAYPVRLKALRFAGILAINLGDDERAKDRCEESVVLARTMSDKESFAWALGTLGFYVEPIYDIHRAVHLLEEALSLFRELQDKQGISHLLRRLSWVLIAQGNYKQARVLIDESLMIAYDLKDESAIAASLFLLGNVIWFRDNDAGQAAALYADSLRLFQKIKDKSGAAGTLLMLGRIALANEEYNKAQKLYEDSLTLLREIGNNKLIIAHNLVGFGSLALAQQRPGRAARLFGVANAVFKEMDSLPLGKRVEFEREVVAARTQLGDAAFAAAWAEGRTMSLDQVIAYALEHEDSTQVIDSAAPYIQSS